MLASDLDYDLPPELIAQIPVAPRDASRLLVLDRTSGAVTHRQFRDLPEYLRPGDMLVLNNTRVLHARLHGRKSMGGKAELLLLRRRAPMTWEAMVGGSGLRPGSCIAVNGGVPDLSATVMEELEGARRVVRFSQSITPLLDRVGQVPLPPYIHEPLADRSRYQTVFADVPGSVAAPTAGLHFTPGLLNSVKAKGIGLAYVTLHIGLDTFAPVSVEKVEDHLIHTEWCSLDQEVAQRISATRAAGGRVAAVGTTTVRVLETAAASVGRISAFTGSTNLFITPGHAFRAVDAMLTNFHLPFSTLLMLVSAFAEPAGREKILAAYEIAKQERYRFCSFGDAMLVV